VGDADSVGHIPQTWQVYRMGGVTQGRLGQFESGAPRPLNGTADAIKDDPSTPRPPSQCSAAVLQHFSAMADGFGREERGFCAISLFR
jgi:hypothetical protein